MPEDVGDLAEAMQRQDQQRERSTGAGGLGKVPPQPTPELNPVGQTRELIVEAHLPERQLGKLLLGHVEDEPSHEARRPVRSRKGPPLVAPPQDSSLPVQDAVLGSEAGLRLARLAEVAQHAFSILRVESTHPHVGFREPLAGRETGHREQLRAHIRAAAGLVGPGHVRERRDLLDQGAIAVGRVRLVGRRHRGVLRLPGELPFERILEPLQASLPKTIRRSCPHELDDLSPAPCRSRRRSPQDSACRTRPRSR